jgi:hypothetical protein
MHVFRHQRVGVNLEPVTLPVVLNSFEVIRPVSVVVKDPLPLIATDNDVVTPNLPLTGVKYGKFSHWG